MPAATQNRLQKAAFLLVAWLAAPSLALANDFKQAEQLEKRGNWAEAARLYEDLYRRDRENAEAHEGYQRCIRQFQQTRRFQDPLYRQLISRLKPRPDDALYLYKQVLLVLQETYVERSRIDFTTMFQSGVQELLSALEKEVFRNEHLAGSKDKALASFRNKLSRAAGRKVQSADEAREQVLALAGTAEVVGLVSRADTICAAFAVEFACGACAALDEYTLFLTPGILQGVQSGLRGKGVGIGIEVVLADGQVVVVQVYPKGPSTGLLGVHDRILRIDRQSVEGMGPETVNAKLRGEVGSSVELEVITPGSLEPRVVKLQRQPCVVPSVVAREFLVDTPTGTVLLGYLRIQSFQDSTLQEVKEALIQLQTRGIRGLLLDLRNNPGGLFKSAVSVAELFVPDGLIASTQGQLREWNNVDFAAESMNPLGLPVVVLVDGNTASAAEVLAGALKELRRARLVGQTTYGKGTIQCIITLEKASLDKLSVGIRVTVARFLSPTKQPYSGQGVVPHVLVEGSPHDVELAARQQLLEILGLAPMSVMGMAMDDLK